MIRRVVWQIGWLGLCTAFFLTACVPLSSESANPLGLRIGANITPTLVEPAFALVNGNGAPTPTPFQPDPAREPSAATTTKPTRTPHGTPRPSPSPTPISPPIHLLGVPDTMPLLDEDDNLNVLLIGSDKRSNNNFRTDALIILSIRPEDGLATLISIPRDLWVYIPEWGMNRINVAYLHGELNDYPGGGPALLQDTIRYNLGIQIDYYALAEFTAFTRAVDTLGGVEIMIACPFTEWHVIDPEQSLENENNWELITIGPGMVPMDGADALWYARARMRSNDFDRGRRQQDVLRALYHKAFSQNIVPQIPQLYRDFQETVETDLGLDDIFDLLPIALSLNDAQIRSVYINHEVVYDWITPGGGSVLLPNREPLEERIRRAMAGLPIEQAERLETPIEVWNTTEQADWDTLAAQRLAHSGFAPRVIENTLDAMDKTWLYVYTPNEDPAKTEKLIGSLGLDPAQVIRAPAEASNIDYRLVLGEDYDPCFNPQKIER